MTPEQGWSQMESMLNKAMPVERRSRRMIIFWWSAAAVVMTAVLSTFLFTSNTPVIDPSVSIIDAKENPASESRNEATDRIINQTPLATQIIASDVKSGSNTSISREPGIDSEKLKKDLSSNTSKYQPIASPGDELIDENSRELTASDHDKAPVEQPRHASLPNTEISFIEADNESLNEKISSSREDYITAFLPKAETHIQEERHFEIAMIEPATKIIRLHRPMIQPFIAAGSTLGIKNGIGADVGAGMTTNLTSQLSINTRLNYQTFKPDFALIGSTSDFAENEQSEAILNYGPVLGNSGFYIAADDLDASVSNEAIIPFIQSITQWQFSAGLSFDFTKRLSLESGVTLGFGTRAISQYPIVTFDYTGTVNGKGSIRNSFDGTIIRNNTTSIFMGVAYSLGKNFDLYAKYTHGLDPYLLTDITTTALPSGTEYMRGLNFGMRYYLCGS